MGIYDRDYYRKEGPSYIGAWADSGKVCKYLVAINVIVFGLQIVIDSVPRAQPADLADPDQVQRLGFFTEWFSMRADAVFYHFQLWRLVTGCFLHGGFWHIAVNMISLWIFGRYMEDLYGHKEFLAFYLVAGVVGNLAWGLAELSSHQPGFAFHSAIGASGAVTGVMVLCALIYPFKTILLGWLIPVPFWLATVLYVGYDLYLFVMGGDTIIAVAAHLGGAAFGLLYQKLDWRLTGGNWWNFFSRMRRPVRPRLRIYKEERPAKVGSSVPEKPVDEQLEARADAVLDKINRQGKDSLTDEERDILQRASEQYRKKRT